MAYAEVSGTHKCVYGVQSVKNVSSSGLHRGGGGDWGLLGSGPLLQSLMFHKLFNLFSSRLLLVSVRPYS